MPAFIDEQPFFDDVSGIPLAGGSLYIGPQGGDPIASPITIYSDRALTTPLANPQTLDANGRSPTKIWIPGAYSVRVDDENGVQKLIDLDRGMVAAIGNTALTAVSGTNTITAAGGISSYEEGQVFIFKAASDNTGAVTLNIDSIGAKAIVTDDQQSLTAGMFQANATVMAVYNSTNDNFRWVNQNRQFSRWYKGADIGSASALTIGLDGNYFDVTGTTTISSINTRAVGFVVRLHFDSILTLTHNATTFILPGGENIVTRAGDEATFIEYESGWRCTSFTRSDGRAVKEPVALDKSHWPTLQNNATDSSNDMDFLPGSILDSTGTRIIELTSTLVKQLDVDWVEGTGQGGHPSGAAAPALGATWHCFVIMKDDGTVDAGFDTALDATNLLADATDYIFYRRIHSFILNTSGVWYAFTQKGDYISYDTHITQLSASAFGGSAATSVSWTATVPTATGLVLGVDISVMVQHNISATVASWSWGSSEDGAVTAPSSNHPTFALDGTGSSAYSGSRNVMQNSSRSFTVDSSNVTAGGNDRAFATAVLHGYYDERVV